MESLRVSRFISCRSSSSPSTTKLAPSFRPVTQVGFGSLWGKTNNSGCWLTRSSTFVSDGGGGGAAGGSGSSRDGSFAVEDDQKDTNKHVNNKTKRPQPQPQPHMRRHSTVMEFPHLSAAHKELMVGVITALESRLQSELLPSSIVPPDIEYYQNQTGSSQGTLRIRQGLQSSHIDFMLSSWLHLEQPNGGGALNVTNLQVYLKPSTNVPHFQLELVQCSPSYMIFFLDLTSRKDLVLNPEYLKTFYEETKLDVYRQKLDQVPEIEPYFSSSLYFRGVVSPTGILVSIKCEDGDGVQDRCEEIIRENVIPIAYDVMGIWMDKYLYFVGEKMSVSEVEKGEMEKRDGLIKRRAIEMDLSSMMPKQFGDEVANRVLGFIKGVFNI